MSQQFQQPQTSQGQQYSPQYGQSMGQQPTTQFGQQGQQQTTQQVGQRFEEAVPSEIRMAVEELEKVSTVAEWAKTQAVQRGLHRAANASDDIAELAEVQKKLIVRQSPLAGTIGQCVTQGIQQHLQELSQYTQEPTIQAEVQEARRAVQSLQGSLGRLQQFSRQDVTSQGVGQQSTTGQGTGIGQFY